jgi:hypothetical protein
MMILDAVGPEQIRTGLHDAAITIGERAGDVASLAAGLGEAAAWYESLQMAPTTVEHLRDAVADLDRATDHLRTGDERLQVALTDFNNRDGRVADAVAATGNLMNPGESSPTFGGHRAAADTPAAEEATPVDDEDEAYARAFEQAAAFIDATTNSPAHQAPPGQDLQHRPLAEDLQDTSEQLWMSLPVRRADVCGHVDTACRECLEPWSLDHDLRVADVPTTVDVEHHHATADEVYRFEGDPDRDLPPYWVARHDRTVTSQIDGQPVSTILLEDGDRASATFAGECCDTTPDGPGAPRPGDRIEISGTPGTGIGANAVTISSSTPHGNGYLIEGTDEDDLPYEGVVNAWEYEIARRPTQQQAAAAAATPEPPRRPEQPDVMDLATLSPGDRVTAYGSVWLYAGTHNGDAVLVEDLRADLDYGFSGYPENGFITATATATTYRAVLASPRQLSR